VHHNNNGSASSSGTNTTYLQGIGDIFVHYHEYQSSVDTVQVIAMVNTAGTCGDLVYYSGLELYWHVQGEYLKSHTVAAGLMMS
jgi:choline-glycine betaine transporter